MAVMGLGAVLAELASLEEEVFATFLALLDGGEEVMVESTLWSGAVVEEVINTEEVESLGFIFRDDSLVVDWGHYRRGVLWSIACGGWRFSLVLHRTIIESDSCIIEAESAGDSLGSVLRFLLLVSLV